MGGDTGRGVGTAHTPVNVAFLKLISKCIGTHFVSFLQTSTLPHVWQPFVLAQMFEFPPKRWRQGGLSGSGLSPPPKLLSSACHSRLSLTPPTFFLCIKAKLNKTWHGLSFNFKNSHLSEETVIVLNAIRLTLSRSVTIKIE